MIDLSVKSNVKSFTRYLTDVEKKQVPYALARALTWTVQDGQAAIIEQIQKVFNSRAKWWLKSQPTGVKIKPAKKDNLTALVFTNAYFATLQEEGGLKTPSKAGKLQVPTEKVPASRRKSGGVKVMLGQKKTFGTKKGVYRKVGSKKDRRIELLWWKTKTAIIKPRFGFKDTAHNTALKVFDENFKRSLAGALRAAK